MRAVKKCSINLGLLCSPVHIYNVSSSKENVKFSFMSDCCKTKIKQEKKCQTCGGTVTSPLKGYEVSKNQYVIFSPEDFDTLEQNNSGIDILHFVGKEQVSSLAVDSNYYVVPDEMGTKPFSLLLNTLVRKNTCAIVKMALRDRTRLGMLRVDGGNMILSTLHYSYELNPSLVVPPMTSTVDEDMLMDMLVSKYSQAFNLADYKDAYKEQVDDMAKKKLEGVVVEKKEQPKPKEESMVDLLRKMLEEKDA